METRPHGSRSGSTGGSKTRGQRRWPGARAALAGGAGGDIWLMFAVALALRVAYAWVTSGPAAVPYSDPVDYDALAWNLATGRGFALDSAAGAYATAFRPPLVPWVTSLLYRVTGHWFFAGILLQCGFGALWAPLTAALGTSMFGSRVGRLAGWLVAVNPLAVFFSGYLLTEPLFVALVVLALVLTVEWIKRPRPGRALGTGLAWGLAALARGNVLPLPALVALWAWVPLGLSLTRRGRALQVGLLALGVALAVGPWTVRNALVLHAFVPVSTNGGHAFLDSNNERVWPALRGGEMSVTQVEPYASLMKGLGEAESDRRAAQLGREYLARHVREWPAMAAAKLARFWRIGAEAPESGAWGASGLLLRLRRLADPLLAWCLLTWPFALWGLVRVLSGPRRWFESLPLVPLLFFTALTVVYWGSLRSRTPIEPVLCLLSAVGAEDAWRRLRLRRSRLRLVTRA